MDAHTLQVLEFPKIRAILASYTQSALGRLLAEQLEPQREAAEVSRQLALTEEARRAWAEGLSLSLSGLRDVRLLVRRAYIGSMLSAEELLQVRETAWCLSGIYRWRMKLDARFPHLRELLASMDDFGLLAKAIEGCLDARGYVLDMASAELAEVRRKLRDLDERIQAVLKRLLRDPEIRKILRYPNATLSGEHYVLPVAANYRHRLPGVVHRTSASGDTVYIEPASLATLSAERAVLKAEEEKEVHRVLRQLTAQVGKVARPFEYALDLAAQLDLILAKARYALDYQMTLPHLTSDTRLILRQARHPLLEYYARHAPLLTESAATKPTEVHHAVAQGSSSKSSESSSPALPRPTLPPRREVVPIDVRLGDDFRILVVTGPNTGGKTVSLKTTGLLCLMAQSGMLIPAAEGSILPIFHHILADIGDEQSIEQSLSTFSAHMTRIREILATADAQSLVLLDDLGAGTDPTEGAALGRAILEALDRIGCLVMISTHLGDLKLFALAHPRAQNAAVEFDPKTLLPTYRLLIGQFGMSCALQIARSLGVPRRILRRAWHWLKRKRRLPELRRLAEARQEAEAAKAQALQAQLEAEQRRAELERRLAELERASAEQQALKEARARLQPGDRVRVGSLREQGEVVRVDSRKATVLVRVGIGQWEVPLEDVFPIREPTSS
ncbi:MAG: DNA strand exchange inhibitor protein [Gemmatales bacterium]|nr:DNA strand exchange inhibitor protein [Gemmatales bacterium]